MKGTEYIEGPEALESFERGMKAIFKVPKDRYCARWAQVRVRSLDANLRFTVPRRNTRVEFLCPPSATFPGSGAASVTTHCANWERRNRVRVEGGDRKQKQRECSSTQVSVQGTYANLGHQARHSSGPIGFFLKGIFFKPVHKFPAVLVELSQDQETAGAVRC